MLSELMVALSRKHHFDVVKDISKHWHGMDSHGKYGSQHDVQSRVKLCLRCSSGALPFIQHAKCSN